VKKVLVLAAAAAAILALPATAATPVFVVGASAVVMPAKPSFAPVPTNFRHVYRAGAGVYCLQPSPRWDWTAHTPLVAPLPAQSKKRAGTLLASWNARGQRCPAAAIEVRTFRLVGTTLRAANDVAFHVLVGGND
jgi:hypothetical protein